MPRPKTRCQGASSKRHTLFHWVTLWQLLWQSWRFFFVFFFCFKFFFEIAAEASTFAKTWDYASSTLLIRSLYTHRCVIAPLSSLKPLPEGVSSTLPLRQRISNIYTYDDAFAVVLWLKCRSCAGAALVLRFENASVKIGGKSGFDSSWPQGFEQDE